MLVLIALILALIPAVFIVWPFLAGPVRDEFEYDEGAPQADLMRRWDAATAGLASAELDRLIGNMAEDDYITVRTQLMSEGAAVMREMELNEDEEARMLDALADEVRAVRSRLDANDTNPNLDANSDREPSP